MAGKKDIVAKALKLIAESAPEITENGIRAYHGSPHYIDKFEWSPRTRGTGEGAQSFGDGLYFAGKEDIAKWYRDKLSMGSASIDGRPIADIASEKYKLPYGQAPTIEHNIADIVSSYGANARPVMEDRYPDLLSAYDNMVKNGRISAGHMYEVGIDADPNRLLNWNEKLGAQSPDVQSSIMPFAEYRSNKMNKARRDTLAKGRDFMGRPFSEKKFETLNKVQDPADLTGQDIYKHLQIHFGANSPGEKAAEASQYLTEQGLHGMQYLDASSRIPGVIEPTKNFVIPEDKRVKIIRRYAEGGEVDPYADEVASGKAAMAERQYDEQPWSEWAGDAVGNALNTAKAILPTALGGRGEVGISDMARGAYDAGKDAVTFPGDVISGKQALFDESGRPLEQAVGRSFNTVGTVGGASSLVPVPDNSLRVFGGIKSKTADKNALTQAQIMESRGGYYDPNGSFTITGGNARDDIWRQAGWGRGAEGGWRYEIPDVGTTVDPAKFQLDLSTATIPSGMKTTLSEYINHPELFAAYPEFKNMVVKGYYGDPSDSVNGYYMPRSNRGTINPGFNEPYIALNLNNVRTPDQQRSTLLHEIQHAVQQKEGFVPGSNSLNFAPDTIPNPDIKIYEDALVHNPAMKEMNATIGSPDWKDAINKSSDFFEEVYRQKFNEIEDLEDKTGKDLGPQYKVLSDQYEAEIDKLYPIFARVKELKKELEDSGIPAARPNRNFLSPFEAYYRTAGEVEARNVQNRKDWTLEQLKNASPARTQEYINDAQYIDWNDTSWRKGYAGRGRVAKQYGGEMRKGYATQGAVEPGPVFIEDAKGTRYDTAGNIIPPAQDQVTDALSVARRETVDPYLMVPGHENLTRVPPVAGPSPEYVRGEAVSAATQPSRDVFWQGVEQFRNPQTEPRTPARAWELLSGAGQIGLGAIGTGFSGAIGAGVEMLPTWLTGPQNQRNKLASELNEMAMFADPMMGPEALAATAPLQRVGGIKNAAAVEGDLAKQRMLERGPSKFYDPLRVSSGIDPTQAGKALANAKDAAIAKVGEAVDPALKVAQEAAGGDDVAAATRVAQLESLNPVPPPQGIFPPTNAFQTAPAIPFDAPTKAFVQFGKPIPPTTPLPDPQLVSSAQADTRMGADIVKRRLPVIVPEQERVVGGIYTPGAPDGRRWSELTPQELAARGPGAKFTDNDLQTIWNQTLAEVSEAGRQAVANTGATWSVFPAEQWDKALKLPLRSQLWYELSGEAFVDRLPDLKYNEHMMFLDLVGATSARARPGENLERALGVLSQRLRGVPVDVDVTIPSTVSAALRRDGRNVSSDLANKTGMFSDTLALTGGLPVRYPISVNDVWVGKAFGITDDQLSSNQALHEVFGKYTNKLRDLVNNTSPGQHPHQSWNLQARQWVELRAADEGIDTSLPVSVDGSDYAGEWDKIAAKLERAGIALPDGRITRDVLLDPRFADALRPTTPGFRAAPKATVEFGTLLTPNGQKSAQIYERARQAGDQNTQDEYLAALTTAMYRTARGKPTLWEETARAALGDTTSVTRIYSPTTDDPFAISGTFGGAAAPNIRVPLRNLTPDQIAYFNAMAGNGLRQKAMAAVEIGRLEPGQALPEGAVLSSSVRFDFSGPIPQKMLTDFASSLGEGFEISAMRYPDGVVFDINPRFGDAGPEAPSVKAVDDAIRSLAATYGIENPRVFDISYKSEYGKNYVEDPGDGTGYGQIINGTLKKWEADTVAQLQSITEGKVSNAVLKKFLKGDDAALRDAAKAGGFPISGYTGRAKTVRKVFQQRLSDHASLTAKWEAVGKEVDDKLGSLIPKWERRQSTATKKAEKGNAPLSPEQRSTNFQSAFGQTYLKNPQGNPMRLYHMTPNDITEFSASPENRSGPVVFLSPYADFQPAYHQAAELNDRGKFTSTFKEGANVMPVYADVRNPLVLDHPRKIKEAAAKYQGGDRKFPRIITPEAKAAMEADGFDAIIFGGDNPIPYGDRAMDARLGHQEARDEEFIIFDPSKIKSATGNRGTYDMTTPNITKALGGAIEDDDDNIYHAVRLARDVGGATNKNPQVFMTDANGVQYDATGKVIQTATPQANSNSSAAPSPTTPQEVGRRAAEDPATFDAMMERYAVPDRDIVDYEALKKQVSQQPQPVQQMTHVGAPPMRDIKVDMPLFGGEYNVGQAPYNIANPMSGVAQTAYDLKTVPLYFTPMTAPIGAGLDVAEGIATGDPLTASLAMAFGPGGKMAKAAGIGAANYFIDPSEAEAGPARWFSKAMEVASALPMEKMTGQQALAMLRKGTSPEELRWTGAENFLSSRPQVSKSELVDYLSKNRVQVNEVTLGGDKPWDEMDVVVDPDIMAEFQPKVEEYSEKVRQLRDQQKAMDAPDQSVTYDDRLKISNALAYAQQQLWFAKDAARKKQIERMGGLSKKPKYQSYSTSGGEGYRENLYTLGLGKKTYKSSHWDDPDVLFHTRSQTLSYDPPGANRPYRVHNVDETQSDWGQDVRKHGMKDPTNNWRARYDEAVKKNTDDWVEQKATAAFEAAPNAYDSDIEKARAWARRYAQTFGASKISQQLGRHQEYLDLYNAINREGEAMPAGPFVGGTEGWTDRSIKQELDKALDSDADYFSWSPGEVHADRYDLSRHIGSVMYDPYYEHFTAFDPNGRRVVSEEISDTQKLDNYVGKELGDKIRSMNEERKSNFYDGITIEKNADGSYAVLRHGKPTMMSGGYGDWFYTKSEAAEFVDKSFGESLKENPIQLSGLDLKTGGEGMRGYYDKVYLKRIQDVIKKATGEKPVIEEIEVQTGNGPRKQLGIKLTDEMREKARFSDFNRGGTVTAPSSYGNDNPAVSRAIALTREY